MRVEECVNYGDGGADGGMKDVVGEDSGERMGGGDSGESGHVDCER